jgi:hypothetical protein
MVTALALWFAVAAIQDDESIALTKLRILTVTQGEIEEGTIVIQGGKFLSAGADIKPPPGCRVVDGKGLVAFPGMIHPHSRLGIFEVATTAGSTPLHLAYDELNPSLEVFSQALRSGFTSFGVLPTGGGIAGQGVILKPSGGGRDELVIEKAGFLRIVLQPGSAGKEAIKQALEAARKAIEAEKKTPGAKPDEKIQPVARFLRGEFPGIVETAGPSELLHFWQVLEGFAEFKPRLSYVGSSDVYQAAAELGARKARVVLRPLLSLAPFTRERINPGMELTRGGAEIAFAPFGDGPEAYQGCLFRVSEMVKFGLPREAALRALTIVPAEIIGIEKRVGSIEAGKDADLLLFSGDPLSPQSRLQQVFINGRSVFHRD